MDALLVFNESAGSGDCSASYLAELLHDAGIGHIACSPKEGDEFERMLRLPVDFIAVAGGDGTVGEVVTKMPDRSVPVAILPMGTANNIARAFGIAGSAGELIPSWDVKRWHPLRIGNARFGATSRRFVEGCGFGALSGALRSVDVDGVAESMASGWRHFRDALEAEKPVPYRLTVDGESLEGEYLMAEILNIRSIGPRLPLAQDADQGDRLFELQLVTEAHRQPLLEWLEIADFGVSPPIDSRHVGHIVAHRYGRPFRLDDEWPEPESEILFEPEEEVVRILAPAEPLNVWNERHDRS